MGEFIPRISVSNDEDAATIAGALLHYSGSLTAKMVITGPSLPEIKEVQRATELLEALVNEAHDRDAKETFGPMPSDEEFAEGLERWKREFGSES